MLSLRKICNLFAPTQNTTPKSFVIEHTNVDLYDLEVRIAAARQIRKENMERVRNQLDKQ